MVNCTESRPGRVTTLMRACAVESVKSARSMKSGRSGNGKVGKRESEKVGWDGFNLSMNRSADAHIRAFLSTFHWRAWASALLKVCGSWFWMRATMVWKLSMKSLSVFICMRFWLLLKAGWLIPLHVEPVDVESDRGFLLAVGFGWKAQRVFESEGVLLLVLAGVAVLRHLSVAGEMLHDHQVHGRFFEIFNFNFVN